MLVEGWEDKLPEDLQEYGSMLRNIEVKLDREDDVQLSRIPIVGGFINTMINRSLDLSGH